MRTGIFAKHGTQEKVMMKYSFQQLPGIVKQLGERYGGNWACVDDLKENEFVTITDSQVYNGYFQSCRRCITGSYLFG